ncbi:FimV/HubP family polar landmark protein [Salinicola sp. LHM]|uniref:type IV pilus assembly protein FimV n=1 Tax=Salinicola sp. LHM TaxID=3065298 RepID=UPI002ACE0A94|nr:FimV/HubP family polar landmark protein [Salinicola sp. LHM]WQH31774.1 FimV/HubP family polar landmark protein [Salinicola sp. LHM]
MRQRLTTITGGLCLVLASSAHALGIGDPQQVSPLHRPLHVVLPLTDGSGLEASQISVAVADDAAYRQSGLSRSSLLDTLSVKVVRREGDLALILDSSRRVREPFLDLLLVVTWPGGQWQRDVSLLFDPVGYASSQPLLNGDRGLAPGYPVTKSVVTQATAMRNPAAGSADDAASATSGSPAWPGQITVRPGDSLSTLAASLLPRSGLDRQPLMLALYQSNPDAFIDGDIDRLRAGVRLAVPAIAAVTDISPEAAASRLGELVHRTDDGRPMIDIVGRREASGASDPDQLAALTRQIADLTAMTERQRATIAALQSERDALQGALAAVAEPSTTATDTNASDGASGQEGVQGGTPVVSAAAIAAAQAATLSPSRVQSPAGTPSGEKPVTASTGPAPASSPSLWQRLLGHLDWIGGGVLIVLLLLWTWERRRRREVHEVVEPVDEQRAEAAEPSPLEASRQAAASMAPRRPLPEVDVDSVSISQADIFMAYGRHAEARDWLRQQLAQKENAQFRLGLLRALGELRDMDALEEALAGFGDDATPEQRREGQALVDDYRARYVEESWQEATGETEAEGETAAQDTVEDVDALFESQAGRVESGAVRAVADKVRPETDEARPDTGVADEPTVRSEASSPAESASRTDSMSVLFDDDMTPSAEPSATSSALAHIDYEAPKLELDAERSVIASPADSVSASLESGNEASSLTMPDIDFSALPLEPKSEMAPDDGARAGIRSARPEVPDVVSPARGGERRGTLREVPAGWDVEEVEFEPSHRDNGRP